MLFVFTKLVNMSLTACWMIIAVLLLRLVLKRAPRFIFCIMWCLIGLRLIVPFTFESNLSLVPSSEIVDIDSPTAVNVQVNTGIDQVDEVVNSTISQSNKREYSANPSQIYIPVAMILWLTGIIIMLIYSFISYIVLKRRVREAFLYKENIYQSERIKAAFLLGIVRPRIYLPYSLNGESMECVIAHEKAHIKRLDHISKPVGFIILILHWFNPFVWIAYIMFCRDMEIACDEKVLYKTDIDKKMYSNALLNCSVSHKSFIFCPPAFGEIGVRQRIKNVLNIKKPAIWIILVAIVACVVTILCFMTNPVDKGRTTNISPIDPEYYEIIREGVIDETQLNRILNKEIALDKPPKFYLSDGFSSQLNSFEVPQMGSYSWNCLLDKDEWNSILACGSGPFELAKDCRRLTVAQYNKMSKTPYLVYFEIDPTTVTVDEYNIPVSWEADPVMISQTTYNKDEFFLWEIERGKIYHIKAQWAKEVYERFGFYGESEYVLVTQ